MWLYGYVAVWQGGYVEMWLCDYAAMWLCGYVGARLCGAWLCCASPGSVDAYYCPGAGPICQTFLMLIGIFTKHLFQIMFVAEIRQRFPLSMCLATCFEVEAS